MKTLRFDHEAFADALRSYRELQGKSLGAVGRETGVSSTSVGKIERHQFRSLQSIIILAYYADIDPTDFVKEIIE